MLLLIPETWKKHYFFLDKAGPRQNLVFQSEDVSAIYIICLFAKSHITCNVNNPSIMSKNLSYSGTMKSFSLNSPRERNVATIFKARQ